MKKAVIVIIILLSVNNAFAQPVVKQTFYKDQYRSKISDEKNARYVETETKTENGVRTIEIKRIKDNTLLSSEYYKNDVPSGIWKYYTNNGKLRYQYNYDFEAPYSTPVIENAVYYDLNKKVLVTQVSGNFSAPVLLSDKGNFLNYLARRLRYPEFAKENGIQGKVNILIEISETGKTHILSIYEGVEKHIDKEAARVLNEIPGWKPAELNGTPIKVYCIVPINFQLA